VIRMKSFIDSLDGRSQEFIRISRVPWFSNPRQGTIFFKFSFFPFCDVFLAAVMRVL
jgi:hypothetical protein